MLNSRRRYHPGSDDSSNQELNFTPLFNGKDLSGWHTVDVHDCWHVEDGNLVVEEADRGWLRTEREYENFILRLEFNLTPAANSGVFLRSPLEGDSAFVGLEVQVLDHAHESYHQPGHVIKPVQNSGSIYDLVPCSKPEVLRPPGEWNSYEILHEGNHVSVNFNGTVVVDANLNEYMDRVDEHPGLERRSGYIGLQSHHSRVLFRNIEISELPPSHF